MPPARVSDLDGDAESLCNDGSAFGGCDRFASGVTQFVGLASAQDLTNSVHEAGCNSTQSLLVMMALADHQPPIDLR